MHFSIPTSFYKMHWCFSSIDNVAFCVLLTTGDMLDYHTSACLFRYWKVWAKKQEIIYNSKFHLVYLSEWIEKFVTLQTSPSYDWQWVIWGITIITQKTARYFNGSDLCIWVYWGPLTRRKIVKFIWARADFDRIDDEILKFNLCTWRTAFDWYKSYLSGG